MQHLSSLSIFFPAFNDAETLPKLIERAYKAASSVTQNFEIIIINDGSTDNTAVIIEKLQRKYRQLRLITHKRNTGYGGALISGFAASKKEWIFYTDGDGQYDPTELKSLVALATNGVNVVNGYKTKRSDSWYRTVIGSVYNAFLQRIFRPPIRDIDCDFRLIKRSALRNISLASQSGAICLELIMKLKSHGAKFTELPVGHYPRQHGQSHFFSFSHIFRTVKDLPKIYHLVHGK